MTQTPPNVRLTIASRPENVALVREVLAGLADAVDFGRSLEDAKAAVSEACNNVVVHAYPGGDGPLEVDIRLRAGELEVVVRDRGVGLPTPRDADDPAGGVGVTAGIGLAVIETLAVRVDYRGGSDRGLEVAMLFEIPELADQGDVRGERPWPTGVQQPDCAEISIAPAALSAAILNRLVGALGVRAGFSIDRLSDAQLVSDAIANRVGSFLEGQYLSVGVQATERRLLLRVDRLRDGGSAALVAGSAIGDLGPVLEQLTDEIDVSRDGSLEVLRLVMSDARIAQGSTA